jgi:hypothetical protein
MADLTSFYYHTIPENAQHDMTELRKKYIELAVWINSILVEPRSLADRSKSLALTELEYSQMRAIQAIALQHGVKINPWEVQP